MEIFYDRLYCFAIISAQGMCYGNNYCVTTQLYRFTTKERGLVRTGNFGNFWYSEGNNYNILQRYPSSDVYYRKYFPDIPKLFYSNIRKKFDIFFIKIKRMAPLYVFFFIRKSLRSLWTSGRQPFRTFEPHSRIKKRW